ncbi:hypothetical protein J5Y09_04855 [Roseomonas sp. PWR1]|uniref:Phasin domain-containing protein n=1 Tax=Roseomonas nitratireducens TaxID=2820810 RepID=A0ABS4APD6_9PROT|nr:hypothetical protein [Neoroseomonas nitratireducens]MBP0463231.1 hypothetical protein [Neoroseomonas nitratireducens]
MDSFTTQGPMAGAAGMPAADAVPRLAATWMRDTMDFMAERLRADARTLQEAGCCDSLSDLTMVQTRWVTEATQAYSEATLRFMESFVRLGAPATTDEAAPQPEPAPRRRARDAEAA